MTRAIQTKNEKLPDPVGFATHDHNDCIDTAIAAAETHCANNGVRLTPVRRKALEILLQEHRALGAYEILDRLRDAGFGSQPAVAYRALEFLVTNGSAHKIERLNAFIACAHSKVGHVPAFMICTECDSVAEVQSNLTNKAFGNAAHVAGFRIEQTTMEAVGLCPVCIDKSKT